MNKADSDALILLQGIIDAWFEEDDGLVLVDYKTDRVKEGGENILLDRYQIQLFYYAKALAQITGKKVKEAVIYSLALQKEIPEIQRNSLLHKKAQRCALARRRRLSQATVRGARMCQGTFFFKL